MEDIQVTPVEENGLGGFDSYRVPGIVTTASGDVLVCYEGRSPGVEPADAVHAPQPGPGPELWPQGNCKRAGGWRTDS